MDEQNVVPNPQEEGQPIPPIEEKKPEVEIPETPAAPAEEAPQM